MTKASLCATLLASALCLSAQAQWGTKWLQDDAYWGDGKAEFNVYDAREVRYNQPRPSFIVHILVRESFAPKELVKADDWKQEGTYPVIKLNQILYVPTGLYSYQQMHSAFWKPENGRLIKASLSSNDGCGNTYKEFQALTGWRSWLGGGWRYHWHTYWQGMGEGTETVRADAESIFYDELPMRVRTIDFTPGQGAFAIPVAPTIINSKKGDTTFKPHTVEWRQRSMDAADGSGDKLLGPITVTVKARDGGKEDVFILDSHPPHLLREWRKSDGGTLKLKQSLKIDYWNHNKLGDQEKLFGPLLHESPEPEEDPKADE
jgi:hypothetical protein